MRKKAFLTLFSLILITMVAVAGTPQTASTNSPVIAFIDFEVAGQEFVESKSLMEEYQADAEYYNSLLKPLEDEIMRLKNSGEEQTKGYQLKVNEYQLQRDKYTNQLQEKYTGKFEQVNQKLLELANDYAQINNIDILLTSKVAVFVNDAFDLTENFIQYANSQAEF